GWSGWLTGHPKESSQVRKVAIRPKERLPGGGAESKDCLRARLARPAIGSGAHHSRLTLARRLESLLREPQVVRQGGKSDPLPPPVYVRLVLDGEGRVLAIHPAELRAVDLLLVLPDPNPIGEVGELLARRFPLLNGYLEQVQAPLLKGPVAVGVLHQ